MSLVLTKKSVYIQWPLIGPVKWPLLEVALYLALATRKENNASFLCTKTVSVTLIAKDNIVSTFQPESHEKISLQIVYLTKIPSLTTAEL